MGSVIKSMAVYDEPFWRADGLTGQSTSDVGPIQLTFDNSPPDGRPGVLLTFAEGAHARELSRSSPAERRAATVACLVRAFGPRAGSPTEFLERDWAAERWSGGCYGAHAPPGVLTQFGPALRDPCGPIHWAGTETATVWAGYMDGAIRSGERVAAALTRA
jgi:monoamine oxidase